MGGAKKAFLKKESDNSTGLNDNTVDTKEVVKDETQSDDDMEGKDDDDDEKD